jgi:cytosine/uracil/thiamine/allantoin permease
VGLLGWAGNTVRDHGVQIPDFSIFNLLVGIGLLKYWRIARWYALVMAALTFILMLPLACWALMNSREMVFQFPCALQRDQRPHEPISMALLCAVLAAYFLFSGWSFLVLSRDDVRRRFAAKVPKTNFAGAR